jgi:hypothetical protein
VWKKSRFYAPKIIFFPIAEGGSKIVGVFRVKNHDFTPKNHIFSNCGGHASLCSVQFLSAPPQLEILDPPLRLTMIKLDGVF